MMLVYSRRKGKVLKAQNVVSNSPTCQMSCGASKRQKIRQSKIETGPRIMIEAHSAQLKVQLERSKFSDPMRH